MSAPTTTERPLWKCEGCGRYSQARKQPRGHTRRVDGERVQCGPFAPAFASDQPVTPQGPYGTRPLRPRSTYRQSLLAGFETCPRRTMHGLQLTSDMAAGNVGASADLGQAVHAVNDEILRTLYRQNETVMPTQEAVEVMYAVLAKGPWVLPADEREALLVMTLNFVRKPWNTKRILLLEGTPPPFDSDGENLSVDIVCQDGVIRTLTGRPDLIAADPPDGIIIVDYKTGWAPPKQPKKPVEPGVIVTGKQYLSDRGHYQLDTYGLLGLERFPQATRATLREVHQRTGHIREATLARDELEHIARELGIQMMKLDHGISEGETSKIWKPRPGSHCVRQCPVSMSCPLPPAQRGEGALGDHETADRTAAITAKAHALYQQGRDQLKTYHVETHYAPEVGDGKVWRWKGEVGDRSFGMHDPETDEECAAKRAKAVAEEQATVDAMAAEIERRQAA